MMARFTSVPGIMYLYLRYLRSLRRPLLSQNLKRQTHVDTTASSTRNAGSTSAEVAHIRLGKKLLLPISCRCLVYQRVRFKDYMYLYIVLCIHVSIL